MPEAQKWFCLNLDALAVPEALVNSFRILAMFSAPKLSTAQNSTREKSPPNLMFIVARILRRQHSRNGGPKGAESAENVRKCRPNRSLTGTVYFPKRATDVRRPILVSKGEVRT